jgi:HEPN domain-containing protein
MLLSQCPWTSRSDVSNNDAYLNDFATRSFRDVADQDYIMARMAFRCRMFPQFLWSGLQAVEKYLKAILLYNRVPQPQGDKRLGHDLGRALETAKGLPFELALSETTLAFIRYLDTYGRHRYLESPYHILGRELLLLDNAVREIRLYCRVIDYAVTLRSGRTVDMLPKHLQAITSALKDPSRKLVIPGGVLERILSTKDHPARASLVWKNLFFSVHRRRTIKWRDSVLGVNPPLTIRPELLDEVRKYVWLPREVIRAYENEKKLR